MRCKACNRFISLYKRKKASPEDPDSYEDLCPECIGKSGKLYVYTLDHEYQFEELNNPFLIIMKEGVDSW